MNKVLIADDEYFIISSLKHRINWEKYGYEVVNEARNGLEAYEKIEEEQPELILVDISMPVMNGLELIQKISENYARIKCIVISGYADFKYAKEAMNYGAIGFCEKPVDDEELVCLLTRATKEIRKAKEFEEKLISEENQENNYSSIHNSMFRGILEYIDRQSLKGNISISDISKQFHLSENYISQLFKKEMNVSYTYYTTHKRIQNSCKLLKNTDYSINQVALESGYTDYFHFAKVFKKNLGVTPTEYRSKSLNEQEKLLQTGFKIVSQ